MSGSSFAWSHQQVAERPDSAPTAQQSSQGVSGQKSLDSRLHFSVGLNTQEKGWEKPCQAAGLRGSDPGTLFTPEITGYAQGQSASPQPPAHGNVRCLPTILEASDQLLWLVFHSFQVFGRQRGRLQRLL